MDTLERELATFSKRLPELQQDYGKFVLVRGDEVCGVFDTYSDALKVGYERFRLETFLVKQITAEEQIHQFSRDLAPICR